MWVKEVHEFFYAHTSFCTRIWIYGVYSIDRAWLCMQKEKKSCNIVADVDISVNKFAY